MWKTVLQAIVGTVVTTSVLIRCIKRKGPVFVSLVKPVGIAIASFLVFLP